MLRDESNEVEQIPGCFGLPDDVEAELNARYDAEPLTDDDIDAMWAREQEEREANVDPVSALNTQRILALKAQFEAMAPQDERMIG